jgi:hypothetical protein
MSKMTDIIKKVQEAAEAVLERAINPEEVIQAIEAIEVLVGSQKQEQQQVVQSMAKVVATAKSVAPSAVTPAVKPKRKYKKRRATLRVVSWKQHTDWLDLVLNGGTHIISTKNLGEVMTSKTQLSLKLRKEAKLRGFKMVHINFSDKNRTVTIQAVK